MGFKATEWFHPYLNEKKLSIVGGKYRYAAKATLQFTGSGVYLIKRKVEGKWKVIYVGMSAWDVKKTLYRHFQNWNDKRHPYNPERQYLERVSYVDDFLNSDFKVRIILTNNADEAIKLEEMLIRKMNPKDNKAKLSRYEDHYRNLRHQYANAEQIKSSYSDVNDVPF